MGRMLDNVAVALVWRYLCHALMVGMALLAEGRPGPALQDAVLSVVPYVAWIGRHNYSLWLLCYVPVALLLWRRSRRDFLHFLYVGGLLSLLRGLCIPLTGLGPVVGPDLNAGLELGALWDAWLAVLNPLSASGAAQVHLTKDLFFSGHTATTFLLWLYCRPHGGLGRLALLGHVLVVAVVFLSHLHYSIDVVGAWAITFTLFTLMRERCWWEEDRPERSGSMGPEVSD